MRVLVAGATGAVGNRLVPALLQAGHQVTGTTRSAQKAAVLESQGAVPVVLDAFDGNAVMHAVRDARPEAIVHQLTSIPDSVDMRRFDRDFALTNRLRTEGLDTFIAAAKAAGVPRFVAQSFTGWPNERSGNRPKTEDDPLDPQPAPALRTTLDGIRHVERTVAGDRDLHGMALRYGFFYGPGTSFAPGGSVHDAVKAGRMPVVGGGTGVWSFLHIDDAAAATVAALERGEPGVYNIVDDEPAPVHQWLPYLAKVLQARTPMRIPAWIARPLIGKAGLSMMTDVRGSSNAKARTTLGWQPRYASWRDGFVRGLS